MARRDDIQYVRYYAYGSAAVKVHTESGRSRREQAQTQPQPREQVEQKQIAFDPVAVIGTAVAVVMLLCVLIGFAQVNHLNDEIRVMESHLSTLRSENYALNKQYHAGYDLEEIQTAAEAMGLVPIDQVEHITIRIPEPEVVEELPWYQQLWNDFLAMIE